MSDLETVVMRIFPASLLRNFRWYRRRIGGFWCHSRVMGWEQRSDWAANLDLQCCSHEPELYNDGKDIEDYRNA